MQGFSANVGSPATRLVWLPNQIQGWFSGKRAWTLARLPPCDLEPMCAQARPLSFAPLAIFPTAAGGHHAQLTRRTCCHSAGFSFQTSTPDLLNINAVSSGRGPNLHPFCILSAAISASQPASILRIICTKIARGCAHEALCDQAARCSARADVCQGRCQVLCRGKLAFSPRPPATQSHAHARISLWLLHHRRASTASASRPTTKTSSATCAQRSSSLSRRAFSKRCVRVCGAGGI